tara:strand:- start:9 stop:224 length:216 start_codon:yes stop_codon:yes gene_type:complete
MTIKKKAPAKPRAKREKMPWDDLPSRVENADYKPVGHRESPRVVAMLDWVMKNRDGLYQLNRPGISGGSFV